jgi:hypothetical protein
MSCARCDELWAAYAAVRIHHLGVIGAQEIATLQHDVETARELERAVKQADADRIAAGEAIRDHELEAHLPRRWTVR